MAIDLVKATDERRYEVAIIMSQGWDYGLAVRLAKEIARGQNRILVCGSAFVAGLESCSHLGIPVTTCVHFDRATYDACRDFTEYRPRL